MTDVSDSGSRRRASRELRHLLRYLLIGGMSVVIDVGLLYTLHSFVGLPLSISSAVAFMASVLFNFELNRIGMVANRTGQVGRHAMRYGVLVLANLAVTVLIVSNSHHFHVSYLLAKMAVVAASTCWNFVLYRRWVFAPVSRG